MTTFRHWLAGFIDGEGCFYIRHANGSYAPQFRLKLRDDDREILEQIVRETGIGYVRQTPGRNQAEWMVITKDDCQRLVEMLRCHPLRAKKASDLATWAQAVLLWNSVTTINAGSGRGTLRHPYQTTLKELKRKLEDGRRYAKL